MATRASAQTEQRAEQAAVEPEALKRAAALFAEGQAAYRQGRLKLALDKLERAHALAPTPEIEFDLGRVYERVGEPVAAIRHFRAYASAAALPEAERKELEARIDKLVKLQTRQRGQLREAPPSTAALTAEARTFFERGKKLFRKGSYEAALAAFSAARRFAALPELAYNLALTSERLSRTDDAVDYYRTYLREQADAPDADAVQARIEELLTDRSPRPASPRANGREIDPPPR
ncbi:MAG: tetratricopeptide repeat protein [Polyangiales bacterium]